MYIEYRHHEDKEYPYETIMGYDAEVVNSIKSAIPSTERWYDREWKRWWFTEKAFEYFCNEVCFIAQGRKERVVIKEDGKEEIITRTKSNAAFDMEIAKKWFAPPCAPMKVQEELLSERRPDGFGLFYDCGVGKTSSAVCEFFRRRHEGRAKRMMVIVFRTTLTRNWQEDVKKIFGYDIEIVTGEMKHRAKKIAETEALIVVAPFTVLGDEECVKAIIRNFDMLVCDEVHCFVSDRKTSKKVDENGKTVSVRKTRFWGLSQLCKNIPNRLALTGTPQPNKAVNSYTSLMVCAPEKFPSKYTFVRRYAELDRWGKPKAYKNLNELRSYLSYYGMTARKKDYCDIPAKTEVTVYCEMGGKTTKALKEAISIQKGKDTDRLELHDYYIKIHQLIACPSTQLPFVSDKLKTLKDYLDNDIPDNEQVIVFTSLRGAVSEIVAALGEERCASMVGGMTAKSEDREYASFVSGKKQVLVATVQKMGVGFNFQCARHLFLYDTAMTGADIEQGVSRVWRNGQLNEVIIYHLLYDIPFEKNRKKIIDEQRTLWEKIRATESNLNSQQRIASLSSVEKDGRAYEDSQSNKRNYELLNNIFD